MTKTASIATVAMAAGIAMGIATEVISSIKSLSYRAGHSGHRKLQLSLIIKRYPDKEGNKVYTRKNKVGNCRVHYDHRPETLTGIGFYAFGIYDPYRAHYDHHHGQFCLLSPPDNTALRTATLKIPSSEGMATIQLGPKMEPDCRRSEELSGALKGQGSGQSGYCPNPRRQPSSAKESCLKERVARLSPSAPY